MADGRSVILGDGGWMTVRGKDGLDGLQTDFCPKMHESIINILHISRVRTIERLLKNNPPRIDVMVEEERGHTRLGHA